MLFVVLLPIVLVLLLAAAFYLPPIQNWAVQKATAYASEQTGMQISIESVQLTFPLDLKINGLEVKTPNTETLNSKSDYLQKSTVNGQQSIVKSQKSTVISVRSLYADIQLLPLFEGQVMVDALDFNYMELNTGDLIESARVEGMVKSLSVAAHGIDLRKDFIKLDKAHLKGADLDITLADSVPEDTTETETLWKIQADLAQIDNSKLRLHGKDLDFSTELKQVKAENSFIDLENSLYKIAHAELHESSFNYSPITSLSKVSAIVDSIYFCSPKLSAKVVHLKANENDYGFRVNDLQAKVEMNENAISVDRFRLETRYSNLQFNNLLFSTEVPHKTNLSGLSAEIGKGDIALFRQYLPSGILEKLPDCVVAKGEFSTNDFTKGGECWLNIDIPKCISLDAKGQISNKSGDLSNIYDYTTLLDTRLDCKNIDFLTQFVDPKILAGMGIKLPHNLPLKVSARLNGSMKSLAVENLSVNIPGHCNLSAKGEVLRLNNLSDVSISNLSLNFDSQNIDFLTSCIDPKLLAGTGIKIPRGIGVKGTAGIKGSDYIFDLTLTEGGGWAKLKGWLNPNTEAYDADIKTHQLAVNHFMPSLGIGRLTAETKAAGKGFNPLHKQAQLRAKGNIGAVQYESYNIKNVAFSANISGGQAKANIDSNNNLLNGKLDIDALMSTKVLNGTISGDIAKINFHEIGLTDAPFAAGLCTHIDIDYDYGDNLFVQGLISDVTLKDTARTFRPDDIVLDIHSTSDTTHAIIDCGDLYGRLEAHGSYNSLLNKATDIADIVTSDLKNQEINIDRIWAKLPLAKLDLKAGKENPLSRLITYNGATFDDANIHLSTTPYYGINGDMTLYGLNADSILLDTISINLKSDAQTCVYSGQVKNGKDNPQFTFNSLFHGKLNKHGAEANVTIMDVREKVGVQLGAEAEILADGVRLTILDDDGIILGYQPFKVNSDNYIMLGRNNRVSADMKLRSSDGKGIGIYTNDDNLEALQDITLTVNKLDLQQLLSAIPYAPNVSGIIEGDFHYIQDEKKFSVSSSSGVKNLKYEGLEIGNISSDFVYMPEDDGGHHIDGVLYMDEKEIGTIIGSYNPAGEGNINAVLEMNEMPMHMANGFIPDQLFGLKGKGDGDLTITGTLEKPHVNGEIFLDSCHLYSTPYGVDMRFSNDPVRIKDSRLLLENFEMYATNDNPLTIAGYIDFASMSNIFMDVRMRAKNFGLIDAKENPRSEAYGKAFVDFEGTMKGKVNNLKMNGRLNILPQTDLAYILRDSPLTTDNQLAELVQFVNTSDQTKQLIVQRPDLYGFNMNMNITITPGTRVMAYLNTDHSNYVDISGNGELKMTYTPADNVRLTGRYNLDGGEMKYSLPIIPLKTFNIKKGGYVEFTGDMMNPRLNITATEKNKAQVSGDNGEGYRAVEFECGVIITKTLKDMGLEFTLDAPQDIDIKSDLATMSAEMRGKLAVTMLTTGMYLAEDNTSTFTMNTALNQFLQSEINNITGNALRTLDVSLGLDNQVDKTGQFHTDYSFRFAKRFWNNRLKVAIGGKVSTGGSMEHRNNNSVLDNVELEYRLDNGGQKYLNLYYNNNTYDWLDGNTGEFGAGFVWRRSEYHFKNLFDFLWNTKKDTITHKISAPKISKNSTIITDSLSK
ncbi:MAG: translocation/assembly module TamB domain-containing protein [Bacteroidaceae bacterium]|nr:translocation/assembly module TamB domain-containing protein [Bacteroidaceae bacterium]